MSSNNKLIPFSEVAKHSTEEDCWVIINDRVYDLTNFLKGHPGGVKVISNNAGKDATQAFSTIHSPDILSSLPDNHFIGNIDRSTMVAQSTTEEKQKIQIPPLAAFLNIYDFESIAKLLMNKSGWAYYSSGADDEITLRENHNAFHRIFFRPRVLVNVEVIDTSTTLLGNPSSAPIFISSAALAKLAHPDGEIGLAKAAHQRGIIQMIPTLSSCSLESITTARQPNQIQWFQLYVNKNRQLSEELVRKAERLGCKALCVTVDAPGLGRREKDLRQKFNTEFPDAMSNDSTVPRGMGVATSLSTFIDPTLNWNDIIWLRSITSMPLIIKGIQTAEDALLAVEHGVKGILLSNHGGRQLDFARSSVEILQEVMDSLRHHGMEHQVEVYVDGGIRRGSDIFKCIALGAKAVGVGRPVLYGLACYGADGAARALEILQEELVMTMRMMGTPTLQHIKPEMIITRNLADHSATVPSDNLALSIYQQMQPISNL